MGQIPRSTERISSNINAVLGINSNRHSRAQRYVQVANNGPAAELDDGSVRAGHVCTDQSHQMLACRVSIAILICGQ